jgi:hypothetical protein
MTSIDIYRDLTTFTDAELETLRTEVKKKTNFARLKTKFGHLEQRYELVSEDGLRNYTIFTRRSEVNPGVFSAGLTLLMPDRNLVLCRYNSGHHPHRNILEKVKVPAVPHKHLATARYLVANLDPDGFAEPSQGYSAVDEALATLVHDCNVQGILVRRNDPPEEPTTITDLFT